MHSTGIRKDPQLVALGALVGSEARAPYVTEAFVEYLGVVHIEIPLAPELHQYGTATDRFYVIHETPVSGGVVQAIIHRVTHAMLGAYIRAEVFVWEEEHPDGTRITYFKLYPTDHIACNRVTIVPLYVRVLSSTDTWRHILPPPLKGQIIAGGLDLRFPDWE